ncbi:hypothetical protein IAU60_000861 [Kwoniella sp. DSM 27419]
MSSRQSRQFAFIITTLTTLFTFSLFLYLSLTPSSAFEDDLDEYRQSGPLGSLSSGFWDLNRPKVDQWKTWLGIEVVEGRDRPVEAMAIRNLARTFDERYNDTKINPSRSLDGPALERLAFCIETNTCGTGEETVVILASFHFNNALTGRTGGEDIWALSTIESLTSLNYTLLYTQSAMDTLTLYSVLSHRVKLVIWEGSELKACLKRNESNWQDLELAHTPGHWQQDEGRYGCIMREGYEEGIPLSKSFTFHFWEGPENPLGRAFTLAPEDWSQWHNGVGNRYLGYSIETRCRAVKLPLDRQHRGMVLGKRSNYFDTTTRDWAWGSNHTLDQIIRDIPSAAEGSEGEEAKFEMIATGGVKKDGAPEQLYDGPIRNLGLLKQDEWYQTLAASKFLLGVGKPLLSPSPYDALCFGVPFINPITWWNKSNPSDWTVWDTQHNGLRSIPAPYVYHVQKGNMEQLEDAMLSAVDNPIGRYIPPLMTVDAVRERHRLLVETDHTVEAELAVKEVYTDKGRDFPYLV